MFWGGEEGGDGDWSEEEGGVFVLFLVGVEGC